MHARMVPGTEAGGGAAGKGRIRRVNEAVILRAAEAVFARSGFAGASIAAIAAEADLPKTNIHYYFGSKAALYRAVLARTLDDWLVPVDGMTRDADPAAAIEAYIRSKMAFSAERPDASRVFANELLHGAPVLGDLLRGDLRRLVRAKTAVIEHWIAEGRMARVDPPHLFFTIWAVTQTYADFDVQVCAVLDLPRQRREDFERATRHVVDLVLRGCGLR